jgi:predicted MFS family arabinose efflux permease
MFYVIGFGLINWGLALIHTSNQNIIFNLRPDAKSRLNAIYMTLYFAGAASGSAIGIFAWRHGGWVMTCSAGLALTLLAALFALIDRMYFHQKSNLFELRKTEQLEKTVYQHRSLAYVPT